MWDARSYSTEYDLTCNTWVVRSYLPKRLEEVGAGHGDEDVDVVDDEERLVLGLVQEEGQVVRDVQLLWQIDPLQHQENTACLLQWFNSLWTNEKFKRDLPGKLKFDFNSLSQELREGLTLFDLKNKHLFCILIAHIAVYLCLIPQKNVLLTNSTGTYTENTSLIYNYLKCLWHLQKDLNLV